MKNGLSGLIAFALHPANRLIGHVSEVIPIFFRRIHNGDTIVDRGFPHVVFSADEAIELLES